MASPWWLVFLYGILAGSAAALQFAQEHVGYNLNENETATNPLDYNGEWKNHTYFPSPSNWRFPFYTLFLDKWVNGDPTNDNINGTLFEHDVMQTQLRHGGDIQGLIDSLDYLQGMGIKGLYVAGSPFINMPWGADAYSPLDLTLLDRHFGDIAKYREMVTEIHKRNMYIIADNTFATMGDLHGFVGYLNTSTPFSLEEHEVVLRNPSRRYLDFEFGNDYNETCAYPRFWLEDGYPVGEDVTSQMKGCYDSEFDQYGDTEAFGVFPDWQRQLSKFASVQDRLREWEPSVRAKIEHFSCLAIKQLDIDGYRLDKATQITVDALGDWSEHMRECARSVGKDNFFIPGEITGGNTFGSVYVGRGKQPDMKPQTLLEAVQSNATNNETAYIREEGKNALDSGAFHYSLYRSLTRFLGMDGNLAAGYDTPVDFVNAWNEMLLTNDMVNPNTGKFDPRHMFGAVNQDVFRWPAIKNGVEKQLLGNFITTLHMPGIPLILWGEEQAFYVLDNTASNYVFGRQAMSSALAWETHGCYKLGAQQYYNFPLEKAGQGCHDPWNSLDHRDPAHPLRNIYKTMYQMRENYPVLNDGMLLQSLSKQTREVHLPGSDGVPTELGLWSTLRSRFSAIQDLSGAGQGNQSVWLVYQNDNTTIDYEFDCADNSSALIAPFNSGTVVKNLFYPHEEITLGASTVKLGIDGSTKFNGCMRNMTLQPWEFKAYVPKSKFVAPRPMITNFLPGHDFRLTSTVKPGQQEDVKIEIHFSAAMNCSALAASLEITSRTEDGTTPELDNSTVLCTSLKKPQLLTELTGSLPSLWTFSASLTKVSNGVHSIIVRNATSATGNSTTGSVDRFIFRTGQADNPVVFPRQANYTRELLHKDSQGNLFVSHKAAGADSWRYTLDWTNYSDWMPYTGGNSSLAPKNWTGTAKQAWDGEHVIVQYYNKLSGSSDYIQHGDLEDITPRRWPHLFAHGAFNQFGFDAGVDNEFSLDPADGMWKYMFMTEWPATTQLNLWGVNPDGQPDTTGVFGDADGDGVLDRMPPSSLSNTVINITGAPPSPHLAWLITVNDGNYKFKVVPVGSQSIQMAIFVLSWIVPIVTAALSVWMYLQVFYTVKFNQIGVTEKMSIIPLAVTNLWKRGEKSGSPPPVMTDVGNDASNNAVGALALDAAGASRRTVLIATMEYDIEDWNIKIKIGGLGVMAQLMGKNLGHQDLIWVVPCVGGIEYPTDEPAEPMYITILEAIYEVTVQYHRLRNITYVLLDAPIFRKQTKTDPYPARMDDLESAVYYSSWNQCIALAMSRFNIDLYHINDYHGAAAPLHLLPDRTIPCALSLHNAEFQGLWPLRSAKEFNEVCSVFNLDPEIVKKYVQFGDVFNLLHAGASYLRIHQKGFGSVGVSKKYGARSHARYPIFWGLDKVGHLPNPDPTDLAEWSGTQDKSKVVIDEAFEAARPELKRQAQEWAGLEQNPDADLLVFVGRWSMQKGIDLIADVMPAVLEEYPKVQLLTIGPVIDLYGKFAALKLDVMMKKYPGRVFSKPEFTALPPFVFSGAEFALIPSRDEPFGLVAVEFGRKGALGIGARVGGLGQMPGWWFTVESTTTSHLLHQFKIAIKDALASKVEVRQVMRAKSAKQRFPVAAWVTQLEQLQGGCIQIHDKEAAKAAKNRIMLNKSFLGSGFLSAMSSRPQSRAQSRAHSRNGSGAQTPRGGDLASPMYMMEMRNTSAVDVDSMSIIDPVQIPGGPKIPPPLDQSRPGTPSGSGFASPLSQDGSIVPFDPGFDFGVSHRRHGSVLSLSSIVGDKKDFNLQKVDPDFTDSKGDYFKTFEKRLENLSGDTSEDSLCIEEFLVKSERKWYGEFKAAKLSGVGSRPGTAIGAAPSVFRSSPLGGGDGSNLSFMETDTPRDANTPDPGYNDEWLLGDDYKAPTGLRKFMQRRVKDWPVYSFFIALGQIIAANSYQITLLSGTIGQTADKLYITAAIYIASSIGWWVMFRTLKSVYVLSIPFAFYGLAFLLLGVAPFAQDTFGRGWVQNVATAAYGIASSSGSIFFALNFGDEGGSPVKSWVFRACLIQGTQQIYVVCLWFWGSYMTSLTASGVAVSSKVITSSSHTMAGIMIPLAFLLWAVGALLFLGLPSYYRQDPGQVPSFYRAMFRRKIVMWFFVVVVIQNYFLSASTGRNWAYLWSSQHAPPWSIALLAILFFLVLWALALWLFAHLSADHSWILPLFAIGLGAPRWAQILWACSNVGAYLPWAGGPLASALAGRALWLWLGTLDALQGVGFGMILLQTLTRLHIAYALIGGQVLGSAATMVARATAPNRIGPGALFPDFSGGAYPGVAQPWFWIGLGFQLLICVGFFRFFRKEQLSKP